VFVKEKNSTKNLFHNYEYQKKRCKRNKKIYYCREKGEIKGHLRIFIIDQIIVPDNTSMKIIMKNEVAGL